LQDERKPLDAGTVFEVKCLSAIDAIAAVYRADPALGRLRALVPQLTRLRGVSCSAAGVAQQGRREYQSIRAA